MDVGRLKRGELIAGVSGLLLFIFMFLDWYGVEVSGAVGIPGGAGASGNAWDWLDLIPIVLLITSIVAVGNAVCVAMDVKIDVPSATIIAGAGALSLLLILYRVVDVPGSSTSFGATLEVDVSRKIGLFLSLIAAGGVAYGGWRAMSEEGAGYDAPAVSGPGPGAPPPPPPGGTSAPPPPPPPPPPPAGGPPGP